MQKQWFDIMIQNFITMLSRLTAPTRIIITPVIVILIISGCATIVPPEGGERDETPPQIVQEESTPNKMTNFVKEDIKLTFDEWIILEDIFSQVIVSPPLDSRPEIKLRKKTVIFQFDDSEVLRDSATYTINFGTAVKDLTEKNPAENLRFVFSTGDQIDSLRFEAQIVDAETREPLEDVLVMLYENNADSVFSTTKPFYFGRTDELGNCLIENIKEGNFKLTALTDANANYLYDQPNEKISFLDTLVNINSDKPSPIVLDHFTEKLPYRLNESITDQYGAIKLLFNQKPIIDSFEIQSTTSFETIKLEVSKDTLIYWYNIPEQNDWQFIIQADSLLNDTIKVKTPDRQEFLDNFKLKPSQRANKINFNPFTTFNVIFNHPLKSIDTSYFSFSQDTSLITIYPMIKIDSSNSKNLIFEHTWQEGMSYGLEILPGAIEDIFGLQNDTIQIELTAKLEKDYGNINLEINNLDSLNSYIIELITSNNETIHSLIVTEQTSFTNTIEKVNPGTYSLKVITDYNANQQWDTGDYLEKRQPEPIFIKELEQLRANWDLEVSFEHSEAFIKQAKTRVPTRN